MKRVSLLVLSVMVALAGASVVALGQDQTDGQKTRQRQVVPGDQDKKDARKPTATPQSQERLEPDDTTKTQSDIPQETQANRHEQLSEEAAVVPYYNNFFSSYRLGPEDVISVSVFNQERYSRAAIVVPPSGRISLALIKG